MRLAFLRGIRLLCASCATAGIAIACSSSGSDTDAGAAEAGVCGDLPICCPMACYVDVCPDASLSPGACFCDADYASPGPSCVTRATAAYACMASHKSDGAYVCTASGRTLFRCDSFCQSEIAAANAACSGVIPCAP